MSARRKARGEGKRPRKPSGVNRRKLELRKRREDLRDGCTGKLALSTKEDAYERAAAMLLHPGNTLRAVGIYICDKCGRFHLSSKPSRDAFAIVELP